MIQDTFPPDNTFPELGPRTEDLRLILTTAQELAPGRLQQCPAV